MTEALIEDIKARTDLAELVSSYGVALKNAGSTLKACCPFHNEKTPSFHVNVSRGFYHCFGCGESGDAIKFVQRMDGLSFVEAVRKLAERVGVKIEEERSDPEAMRRSRLYALLADIAEFYRKCLAESAEAAQARAYVKERDLAGKTAEDYLIGYAPAGTAAVLKWAKAKGYTADELDAAGIVKKPDREGDFGYHRFGGRLMFTIKDRQERVVGFSGRQLVASKNSGKYVNSPETPVFKKSNVLYGLDKAAKEITKAKNHEAIVCEGQIDCIRLQTSGFPNSVAGQGTAFTAEHAKMLRRFADQVALVYDDDEAGHKATVKTARLCLSEGLPVRVVSLPGGDDPDSFLRSHPAAEFSKMLDSAESIVAFQTRTARAAEKKPDSVDAVNRTAKAVLETISACANAIQRAAMVSEAAKVLGIPAIALDEELAKIGSSAPERARARQEEPRVERVEIVVEAGADAEDASKAIPPSERELAFCEFLMANEYSESAKTLSDIVGEFLPQQVFSHDFTRRFVEVWKAEIASGEDKMAPWGDSLRGRERSWFDAVLTGQAKTMECGLEPVDVLEDFVRTLWSERLRRIRGGLPISGNGEADALRMKITLDLKRLNSVKWNTVKELVRDWIAFRPGPE